MAANITISFENILCSIPLAVHNAELVHRTSTGRVNMKIKTIKCKYLVVRAKKVLPFLVQ